ncbi:MAG: polysaccharide biosynthesis/export family protein [Legionellaceae bacterium]|jgi:protein involved in polysaccharide export with SLBB domain|nr:polysaccharide biosynthesis/export family protein [Legionellaceae bacterium]
MAQEVVDVKLLTKVGVATTSLMLCGCAESPLNPENWLPGMKDLNTYSMRKHVKKERIQVKPTLIPITPTLIADQTVNTYFYRVAPADVLHVNVWQHPEFEMESQAGMAMGAGAQGAAGMSGYLVDPRGRIYFPLIGYVHVADKTLDEIRIEVSRRLAKYIPNPQVNVRVADFRGRKVYVLGEVMKKGFLPITDQQLTIADALAQSGWLDSKSSNPNHIYVIRGDYTQPQIFWLNGRTPDKLLLAEHFSLQPQDVLFVSAAPIAQMNRVLDQLLPIVQTIWFTQSVIKQSKNNI